MNIPLREFMVETFSLKEFIKLTSKGTKEDLFCNILEERYSPKENLIVIDVKFLSEYVIVFMRWEL